MSGKFRKVFDNKHFVMLDRPLGPKFGKIVFFELDNLDNLQREYDEVKIDNLGLPTTGIKEEDRRWYLMSEIKFKNFKLLRPKLSNGLLMFDYEAEEGVEELKIPWQDYSFGD